MIGFDPVPSEAERIERLAIASGEGDLEFIAVKLDPDLPEIDSIKPFAVLHDGFVAAQHDIGNDGAHSRFHIGHRLSFGGKKGSKGGGKVGRAAVEADRHGLSPPVRPGFLLNGPRKKARQECASARNGGASSTWTGRSVAGQDGPRSASSASRHSTSRRNAPPPEKIRVTAPAGGSVSVNSTASRLRTSSLPAGLTLRHLQPLTRSK